jgi:Uma2 family endonuclease
MDHIVKRQLYARHGVPYYWIVDPAARSIEALVLGPEGYEVAVRATGVDPVSPPPFSDLALVPDDLWP